MKTTKTRSTWTVVKRRRKFNTLSIQRKQETNIGGLARYLTDLKLSLGLKDTFRLHFHEEDDLAIKECTDSDTQFIEVDEQLSGAHECAVRYTKREEFNVSCMRSNIRSLLRKEFLEYWTSIANQAFTDNHSRSYWHSAKIFDTFPGLAQLARLFLNVSASPIAQERQLSELKRRSWGFRNRLKMEIIDCDSMVSSSNADVERENI